MSAGRIRTLGAAVLTIGLAAGAVDAFGQAQPQLTDAQIEANVLRALAGAPDLSAQNIQTSTVYGTVTLTGNVHDETLRTKAENLAARAQGVKKVVDELTLGDTPATPAADASAQAGMPSEQPDGAGAQASQPVLLSDGTYGPAPDGSGAQTAPPADTTADTQAAPVPDSPQQGPPPRQPMYQRNYAPQNNSPIPGGQEAGLAVTVPDGSMLRIRINRGLDSNHTQPGSTFDGIVLTDVIAGGAVAIPRGAGVSGVVVDAKKAGTFKGEGELSLQINSLTLGGTVYPIATSVWARNGKDKTAGTVNNTVGGSAVGAIFGAIVGGGEGAAIGAGVGAGAGLAGSAASPRGQIIIPPESVLTFTTSGPAQIKTVSEQEMARLSYAAGPQRTQSPPPARVRYYSPQYGYYYGPPPAYPQYPPQ
jgi:hypothetical protein